MGNQQASEAVRDEVSSRWWRMASDPSGAARLVEHSRPLTAALLESILRPLVPPAGGRPSTVLLNPMELAELLNHEPTVERSYTIGFPTGLTYRTAGRDWTIEVSFGMPHGFLSVY